MSDPQLKTYTPEEIELFLSGDRREVDRLLLHGLNTLTSFLVGHAHREEAVFAPMGSEEMVRARTQWIDAQIKKDETRCKMMQKIAESTAAWALPLLLGFIALATWDSIVAGLKAKLGI